NTPLHYCISENNFESIVLLTSSRIVKNIINYNLYNIDGKIPLILALEIAPYNLTDFLDLLLNGSNINIQDDNGYTCLHYICAKNLWKEYSNILKKKKLNILVKNKLGERPVDLVDKNDHDTFINLVIDSYIYTLRNTGEIWKKEWENMCKNELFIEKMDETTKINISKETNINLKEMTKGEEDVCRQIIRIKLLKLINELVENNCNERSYPIKKEAICIKIHEGKRLDICTFTGTTLDVLVGLIYLLKTHPDACSTLTKNFSANKDLCRFYKSIGIIMNTRCEFLNFEIVWIHQKLYLIENFSEHFKKCLSNNNKKFIIIPLGIEMRQGSHANYLIYDKTLNEIERFEPHGSNAPFGLNYNANLLDDILETKFQNIDTNIKYIKPKDYLPKIGLQLLDINESKKKQIGDPGGFCALWSIWYVDMRLTYSNIPRNKLIANMIKTIKYNNISFKNLIRNYSKEILEIRDNILVNANLNINDWLNDQYSDDQVNKVLEEITKQINQLI
ncbi:MAG: ankyrin repeat protein, partial [Edafosvirus sp.]